MEKKVSKKDYVQSLQCIGKVEKLMTGRVFALIYLHEMSFSKIPTVQEIQTDLEVAGLGKPSLARIRTALKKDRRTMKINDNQWRIKTAEIDEELAQKYSTCITSVQDTFSGISTDSTLSIYSLHPKIEAVAISPFKAKLYKEAIQNALVEVIDYVKIKSGNPVDSQGGELDGDKLMQRVFGCDTQQPIIKLNSLKSSLDKAEQRGIMNLYKGIVGIRDRKAHLNFIQKDPKKAFEYLVLASLLLRLVDENTK